MYRHSRIHPVLDQLQKPVLVLILGGKSLLHNILSCVTTKLVDWANVNVSGIGCLFILEIGCSKSIAVSIVTQPEVQDSYCSDRRDHSSLAQQALLYTQLRGHI